MGFAIGILFLIFGGGYYVIRFLMESGENQAFKQSVERDRQKRKDFEKLVCDEDLHDELLIMLHDDPDRVLQIAKETAGNESWFWKLDKYDIKNKIFLARNGKLDWFDAASGISCNTIKFEKGIKYVDGCIARGEFILWLSDQLKKHGIENRVIVKSYDNRYRLLTKDNPYDKHDREYIWEQVVSSYVKIANIKETYPESEK